MIKIGLFGGSFNPVHNGHINLALSVKNSLKLDKIIMIPAGIAPHKSCSEYAPASDRIEMCRLACESLKDFEVSDYEILQSGKNYTIYTVRYFKKLFPDAKLFLLIGSDMLLSFEKWFCYNEILENTTVTAVSRTGTDFEQLVKMSDKLSKFGECIVVNADSIVISSSKLRKILKNNGDVSCYLNEKVVKYIISRNLYKF